MNVDPLLSFDEFIPHKTAVTTTRGYNNMFTFFTDQTKYGCRDEHHAYRALLRENPKLVNNLKKKVARFVKLQDKWVAEYHKKYHRQINERKIEASAALEALDKKYMVQEVRHAFEPELYEAYKLMRLHVEHDEDLF